MSLVISYLNSLLKLKKKIYTKKDLQRIARRRNRELRRGKVWKRTIRKRPLGQALSLNKIFIAYGSLKHTSSNLLITLFVYNVERLILIKNFFEEHNDLYTTTVKLTCYVRVDKNDKEIKEYNRPFTLKEFRKQPEFKKQYNI